MHESILELTINITKFQTNLPAIKLGIK